MNTSSNSSPAVLPAITLAPLVVTKPLVIDAGADGEVVHLGSKAEIERAAIDRPRVVYVVGGDLTVRVGATNNLLKGDDAHTIPARRAFTVINHGDGAGKVLVLTLPAARVEYRLIEPDPVARG